MAVAVRVQKKSSQVADNACMYAAVSSNRFVPAVCLSACWQISRHVECHCIKDNIAKTSFNLAADTGPRYEVVLAAVFRRTANR